MYSRKRKYIGRWVALLLAMPFVVFAALITLLYLPQVQHWVVGKVAQVATDATGMDIRVGHVRLAFPLDLALRKVVVCDSLQADTLAFVGELRTGVAVWPLLRGEVQMSGISLRDVEARTGRLIPSVEIDGRIGALRLKDGDVNLSDETVRVESLMMTEADVSVTLHPDDTPKDTVFSPVCWKIFLGRGEITHMDFRLSLPADTMNLAVGWDAVEVEQTTIDLGASAYGAMHFALAGGHVAYNGNDRRADRGFDPNHLDVTKVELDADSLYYRGNDVRAVVRQLAMQERSGLRLTRTEADVRMDSMGVNLPHLLVETGSSRLQAKGILPWDVLQEDGEEEMNVKMEGTLSGKDLGLLADGVLSDTVVRALSESPLQMRLAMQGHAAEQLRLDTLALWMDNVVRLGASGEVSFLTDDGRRMGQGGVEATVYDPYILTGLMADNGITSLQIPQGTRLEGTFNVIQTRYGAALDLHEREGRLKAEGHYDTRLEEYALNLQADSLPLHHFLPEDSIGHLTAHVHAVGKGTDPYGAATRLTAYAGIDSLQYGNRLVENLKMEASLEEHQAQVAVESRNALLEMKALVEAALYRDSLRAKAVVDVADTDLPALRMTEAPWTASVGVEMKPDLIRAQAETGDFALQLDGGGGIESLIGQANTLVSALQAQLKHRRIRLEEAKALLPDIRLSLNTGNGNPIAKYLLNTSQMGLKRADVEISASPSAGLLVDGHVYGFHTDSLEFDTVRIELDTDEDASLAANLSISNAPHKRKPVFAARLDGHLTDGEASALLHFYNGKHELGLEFGARATRDEEGKELRLSFFPQHPTIGFRDFTLNDSNYVALSDSGRITANVTILDKAGTGLRLYSSPNEEALQDLTVDLTRLNLAEILTVLPYAPDVEGLLDTELRYVKTPESNTFLGTVQVDGLAYEGYALGTMGVEAAYLPTSQGEHIVNLQLLRSDELIAAVDGKYGSSLTGDVHLERFPLEMANAFLPQELVNASGWLGGDLSLKGDVSAPRIDGEIFFDSVQLHSPLYALDLRMDKTPVSISGNRLMFEDFNIYAKGKNPFTLTGNVNLGDFSRMTADLQMRAVNYELLNAKANRNSVVHGKVFVSLFATIRGELTAPVVRGNMNILGNTDVTYVLKESPLTVEDRLGSMVTFVNFNDTLAIPKPVQEVTLGGLDMLMNVQIEQGAQVQVDLGSENYVEVQGGGNLSMQYTPQGDFLLTGRYTLNNGEMKYSLPIIPLKTFKIQNGSYVEFTGNAGNPYLHVTATERVRTSVAEDNSSRYVNFDVGVSISNSLDNMGIAFMLNAPEDVTLQNQLAAMSAEERGKLAVTMLVTGMYVGGQGGGTGGFNTGNALNSFLQSEISNIAGSALKTVDVSIGVEDNYSADGTSQGGTDYSFRFAKRFWNNRLSVIIGGRISTGNEAVAEGEGDSFIDDISLEWRLDDSGTRYVKLFHTKNYESILEGEIIETGVGLVLRRKVNKLGELFIFRRKE